MRADALSGAICMGRAARLNRAGEGITPPGVLGALRRIDPSDLGDVLWAITTRCEPAEQTDIIRDAWSSALHPRIPLDAKLAGVTSHSKAIIDACCPFAWKDKFPPASSLTPDEARIIEAKWGAALKTPS